MQISRIKDYKKFSFLTIILNVFTSNAAHLLKDNIVLFVPNYCHLDIERILNAS